MAMSCNGQAGACLCLSASVTSAAREQGLCGSVCVCSLHLDPPPPHTTNSTAERPAAPTHKVPGRPIITNNQPETHCYRKSLPFPRRYRRGHWPLGLFTRPRYSFTSSIVHESVVLSFFRPAWIVHIVAILMHDYRAVYDPPSTSLVYAMHHTILVITISCKGQTGLASSASAAREQGLYGTVCV